MKTNINHFIIENNKNKIKAFDFYYNLIFKKQPK